MLGSLLDLVIIASLIALAIQTVRGPSLFRSIIHFIVLGLTLALAWARLGAPDLAMAEAAIGAGVTGALMMVAYRRLVELAPETPKPPPAPRSRLALPIAIASGGLVGVLGLAAILSEPEPALAGLAVIEALELESLGNPITGVLLLYRGLDTLLEVAVLLTAFISAVAVTRRDDLDYAVTTRDPDTPLVGALLAIVVPLTLLIAVHLLKAGSQDPGGAFQAGAVLAACGVLLVLTGRVRPRRGSQPLISLGLVAGLISFSLIGLAAMLRGQPPMTLPGNWAVYWIETAMMLSIALTLVLLFASSESLERGRHG